jgi:Flp pilus assembly protein TadG
MRRKNQRGFALATMGIWVLVLFVFAALAIDVSRLVFTATEVQAVADSAATAAVKTATENGDYAATAKAAAAKNRTDGGLFDVATQSTYYELDPIEAGTYNVNAAAGTDPFTAGGAPWNAVRVKATAKQVSFIFGGFMSAVTNFAGGGNSPISTSTPVSKVATAVCAPPLGSAPDLPIVVCANGAIGLHLFQPGEACDPNQLGTISPLNPLPNTQDACWNNLGTGTSNPSNADLLALFPPDCGGSVAPPVATDGQTITDNNGSHSNLFSNLVSCINMSPYNGTRNFTIPVISSCGLCNTTRTVQGFVTIQLKASDIKTNNGNVATFGSCNVPCGPGGCPQGIYCAKQVCNSTTSGSGIGTSNFGSCIVRLG